MRLIQLKEQYDFETLLVDSKSEMEIAMQLMHWTNSRWEHNGDNQPSKNDALTILKEAGSGSQFRCVEYGIVLSASLNAMGIPARVIGLKTEAVETTKYGAGHVATEAYIKNLDKWVFLDAQMNYVPYVKGVPLNAAEYMQAIIHQRELLELYNANGKINAITAKYRIDWVVKYLFYLNARFDATEANEKCQGKSHLMLVPEGAKEPTVFQRDNPIDYCLYTRNLKDFYPKPLVK